MKRRNRRIAIGALCLLFAIAIAGVAAYSTGYGRILSATTTAQRVTPEKTMATVSVYNRSTNVNAFALVNCTTNVMATRLVAGTAIPIAPGSVYTFNAQARSSIKSFCYATTNSTAQIFVGGF